MSMLFLQKMKYNFTFCKKYAIMLLGEAKYGQGFFSAKFEIFFR